MPKYTAEAATPAGGRRTVGDHAGYERLLAGVTDPRLLAAAVVAGAVVALVLASAALAPAARCLNER